MKKLILLTATMALSTGAAFAQAGSERDLVTVNIENVVPEIAAGLTGQGGSFPNTVQVPATVASNVCNVDPNVLAAQLTGGNAYCEAVIGSPELAREVERVMAQGYATPDETLTGSTNEESSIDEDDSGNDGTDDGTDDGGTDNGGTDDGTDGGTDGGADDGGAGDDSGADGGAEGGDSQ